MPFLSHRRTNSRHDLAAHIYRLREGYSAEKHIVNVVGHRLLGYKSHLGGDKLSVRALDGFAGSRILDQVELVALRGEVETLCRQHLVAVEYRYIALVVEVAAVEVDTGQIGRKSFLLLVAGLLDPLARHHELLVVGKGHLPEFGQ